jgi:hypothetical protein
LPKNRPKSHAKNVQSSVYKVNLKNKSGLQQQQTFRIRKTLLAQKGGRELENQTSAL